MLKAKILLLSTSFFLFSCASNGPSNRAAKTGDKSLNDEIANILRIQGGVTPVNQFYDTGVVSNTSKVTNSKNKRKSKKKTKFSELNLVDSLELSGGDEKLVQQWVEYFSVKDKDRFQRMLNRGEIYREVVQNILLENGLPSDLFYLALIESGFVIKASSHASAKGVWQFMKGTGKQYGLLVTPLIDEREDPIRATEAAAKYLRKLYSAYESWELAFAAYNAGEYRVLSSIMKGETRNYWELAEMKLIPSETRNYVPKIIAAMKISRNLEKYGFKIETQSDQVIFPDLKMYEVRSPVRVKSISKALGISEKEVLRYNPHLKNGVTPMGQPSYQLWFPDINSYEVARLLSSLPREKNQSQKIAQRVPKRSYKVKRGDTLSGISQKLNTPISLLKKFNKITSNKIYVGQRIKYKAKSARGAASQPSYYKVGSGDTLSKISQRFNIRISNLKKYNKMSLNNIYVGQKIFLNSINNDLDKIHVVKRGENLTLIARKYGMNISQIKRKNKLKNNNIFPGQKLNI
jgi:membrane-bound lytic murein transglycosylase D